jgi:hypothetical protein
MSLLMFLIALAILVGLLSALVKVSYELGKDDGWDESGEWLDDHAPVFLAAGARPPEDRPASRDVDA